nr:preprotein translocase subunit SecG [Deinobacterium chartae]
MLYIVFAIASVGIVLFVLLQTPKQSGLSSGLGGSGELFGGRGMEGGLVRVTSILGGIFLVLSLVINILTK